MNPDDTKREWRRRFFVLKKALGSGTQTLEYFKDKEWRKQEPKGVLTLFSGYTAYKVLDPKKKLTFEVKTMDSFFVLSATTEESREKWIEVLQQNSSGIIAIYSVFSRKISNAAWWNKDTRATYLISFKKILKSNCISKIAHLQTIYTHDLNNKAI